jgi:xylulokinase
MFSIGYDIGSSSIKVSLLNLDTGQIIKLISYPDSEMTINAVEEGWAEQNPDEWWSAVCKATQKILSTTHVHADQIKSIGIAYQMHGLVLVNKDQQVLRPSIIWCDSRAVEIGNKALHDIGKEYCFDRLLNSPGNFTASKLKWVQQNEPKIYEKIYKAMLPGDFIAMKLSGEINTTITGLSEGIFWDFKSHSLATNLLEYYNIDSSLIPKVAENFVPQCSVSKKAALETGLCEGTIISYRAGDQPNNALSLNVLNPGDIAATGGTSGVVYGVSQNMKFDHQSRINSFAHVNHSKSTTRVGQLLCINGAGSQYAWIRKQMTCSNMNYSDMEEAISEIPIGSDGLRILPFGNGAERMLNNKSLGAQINNVQFNKHQKPHFYRASLEGIAFSFVYGINILRELGVNPNTLKVGNDNLFQSSVFSNTIASLLDCSIQMIETTGASGAAKASGIGIGHFSCLDEAISNNNIIKEYLPKSNNSDYARAYNNWAKDLEKLINN